MTTHNNDTEIDPEEYRAMEPPLILPADPHAAKRAQLQTQYNFLPVFDAKGGLIRDPAFNAVAQEVVDRMGGVAGVNYVDKYREQKFLGIAGDDMEGMTCDQGACSTAITRRTVKGRTCFAMNDLDDFAVFTTNDMYTKVGLRTYVSSQIIPPEAIPIGTVFRVSKQPAKYRQADLDFMKGMAAKVMALLIERQRS